MSYPISRRTVLKTVAAAGALAAMPAAPTIEAGSTPAGWVSGKMSGARALVETLQAEGTLCVFGIPGAQENELWDEMKSRHLPYLLVTHEASASAMADGAARSSGRPGVICIVPGPGVTNALTGIGEALLDSVPMVCIVGDVARGEKYKAFQVHEMSQVDLLKPVCKLVLAVSQVSEIPGAVRQAFQVACAGEPGPVAVVVPYNLLIESHHFNSAPLPPCGLPYDDVAVSRAIGLLADRRLRVGIYAGLGCQDHSLALTQVAELLQAPVATSVSGKGAINECHPLAVGWGYGPQGTAVAEKIFERVDVVLAIGVRFSEVSTGFYSLPDKKYLIHVDASAANLGRVMKGSLCVHADAGLFLARVIEHGYALRRATDPDLLARIRRGKEDDLNRNDRNYARCGTDPLLLCLALSKALNENALTFVDVSMSEHWCAEVFTVHMPRTYFNPTDNQAMGWSIPAALGAQRIHSGRQVVTITGDGCFLMSAMEISTAGREGLPVKIFILDDQAYHYMQTLQNKAYKRTTATILARLDYAALAKGFGVGYAEIPDGRDLEARVRGVLAEPGPMLVRVVTEYGDRPCRWIKAVSKRFTGELSTQQKVRFAARLGSRAVMHREND